MKIGILSLNMYTTDLNWACRLHTYAFQQFLDQHEIDNVIIDYVPQHNNKKFDLRHPYDHYMKHPKKDSQEQKVALEKWKELYVEREKRYDLVQDFINQYYRKTANQYDAASLDVKSIPDKCDIYICATDVLWKYRPRTGYDKAFFLASRCMEGKGKIAYSVSKSGMDFMPEQLEKLTGYINDFDYVSVRERSLYHVVKEDFGKEASIVLDPVLLHDAEFYEPLCAKPEETGYVLVYLVIQRSTGLIKRAYKYAKKHNLQLIELSENMEDRFIPEGTEHVVKYDLGVEEWLGYIKYADCIFTNSFHCCCLCVLFQKQFYVGYRTKVEKIKWFLEMFGLSDRWIKAKEPMPKDQINYEPVENALRLYRELSEKWILDAIREVALRLEHSGEEVGQGTELHGIEIIIPDLVERTREMDA